MLVTVVVFAVLLGVLVVVHEFGHYLMAKRTGMKAHEFAFGFGPRLVKLFNWGETEFTIRAVPLGGFVRIAGMEPGEEGDVEGGFNSKPAWARALVVLAGPVMSLVLGYIVFILIGFVWGYAVPTNRVDQVVKDSPAYTAGLKPGDAIIRIGDKRITDGNSMLRVIRSSAGRELTIEVKRRNEVVTLHAVPKLGTNPELQKKVGQLGFVPVPHRVYPGIIGSFSYGTRETYAAVYQIITTLFSRKIKEDVGGIVAIGYMTSMMVKAGAEAVFFELAALSVMLGIINLVPWPVLDGGHLLYLAVEKVRGKRLEPEKWYAIQMAGMAVLIFLAVFLVYFDISRIISGTFPK